MQSMHRPMRGKKNNAKSRQTQSRKEREYARGLPEAALRPLAWLDFAGAAAVVVFVRGSCSGVSFSADAVIAFLMPRSKRALSVASARSALSRSAHRGEAEREETHHVRSTRPRA